MKSLLLSATLVALLPSTTRADHPLPPVPAGGLMTTSEGDCVDTATQVPGHCIMQSDLMGRIYLVFLIDDLIWEIRHITDGGYTVLWTADHAATSGEML